MLLNVPRDLSDFEKDPTLPPQQMPTIRIIFQLTCNWKRLLTELEVGTEEAFIGPVLA